MFEAAELGRSVSKEDYKAREPILRAELLAAQTALREANAFPVIIVFGGVDGAGKGETVNLLNAWMDPRWTITRAFGDPSDEERERPEYWRYWRALPPRGRIGLFLSTWYSGPLLDRVYRRVNPDAFDERLNRIVEFEQTLADDGALILKFWMHLDKAAQKKRLKHLERDPLLRWKVTELEWKHWRMYEKFIAAAERAIRQTSRGSALWTIVDGEDARYRSLAVAEAIRDAIRQRLSEVTGGRRAPDAAASARRAPAPRATAKGPAVLSILSSLDMMKKVPKTDAGRQIDLWQGRLNLAQRKARSKGISTILVWPSRHAAACWRRFSVIVLPAGRAGGHHSRRARTPADGPERAVGRAAERLAGGGAARKDWQAAVEALVRATSYGAMMRSVGK